MECEYKGTCQVWAESLNILHGNYSFLTLDAYRNSTVGKRNTVMRIIMICCASNNMVYIFTFWEEFPIWYFEQKFTNSKLSKKSLKDIEECIHIIPLRKDHERSWLQRKYQCVLGSVKTTTGICWDVLLKEISFSLGISQEIWEAILIFWDYWILVCFLKLRKHREFISCFENKTGHILFLKNISLNFSPFLIIKCIVFLLFSSVIHTVVYSVITSNLVLFW